MGIAAFFSFSSYICPPSLYPPVLSLWFPLPHMEFQSPLSLLFHNSNCVLFKHLSVQRNENKTTVQKITEFTPAQKTQWHATNSWTQSTREIDSASRIWEKKNVSELCEYIRLLCQSPNEQTINVPFYNALFNTLLLGLCSVWFDTMIVFNFPYIFGDMI